MKKLILIITVLAGLLHADQLSESGFLLYLKDSFERHDKKINELLPNECRLYLRTFPGSANIPVVLNILARVYDQDGSYIKAFVYYLEIVRLYPQAEATGDALDAIRYILQKKATGDFEGYTSKITAYLSTNVSESTLSGRFRSYLEFLHTLNHEDINPLLIDQLIFYIHTFDQDVESLDELLYWTAGLYKMQRDRVEAMMAYEKILYLKPESPLIPQVLFDLAWLQYNDMDRYTEARDNFIHLITDYPDKEVTGDAQFYLAELYQKKLDKPGEAMTNYELLIQAYPTNKHAVEALKRMAVMHYDADEFEKAISVYEEIFDKYKTDPFAPEALSEIENIYRKKFNDYGRAAETLLKLADSYPDREETPEVYYDAADMYREELNDPQRAKQILNVIIEKYPDSRYAGKAKDDIQDMENKP
jgi:TolA-binding protein